jgi:hypothetical protein
VKRPHAELAAVGKLEGADLVERETRRSITFRLP